MNSYYIAKDLATVKSVFKRLHQVDYFSFDLETTSLDERGGEILGIGFSWEVYKGVYIPLKVRSLGLWAGQLEEYWVDKDERDEIIYLMKALFSKSQATKIAHNAGFDIRWIHHKLGVDVANSYCTLMYEHTADSRQSEVEGISLIELIHKYEFEDLFHLKDIWKELKKKVKNSRDLSLYFSTKKIGVYCCGDCDGALRIYLEQEKDTEKPYRKLFNRRIRPAVNFIARMSGNGFLIDRNYLTVKKIELEKNREKILRELQAEVKNAAFNPDSTKDLQTLFFSQLKLKPVKEHHLDEWVLEIYAQKYGIGIASRILEYRKIGKLLSTYFIGIENNIDKDTGRVYPDIKSWGTETGRPSCANPNLMNLPVRVGPVVKRMFITSPGKVLIGGDYSQIELRLIAEFSQDPMLLKAYAEDIDLHALTASKMFGVDISEVTEHMRFVGKGSNFLLCYLGGEEALIKQLGNKIMGSNVSETEKIDKRILLKRAAYLREKYFNLYVGIPRWTRRVIKEVRKNGYVTSAYGRIRYLPAINSGDIRLRSHAEKQAVNMNPQATAYDYMLFRFQDIIKVCDEEGLGVKPLMTVYDQMIMEAPEKNADRICRIMEMVGVEKDESNVEVPMKLEPTVGYNLGEL